MPSAVSEHFPELIGCPISWSLATSCVCLELRLLPSTGITRLRRYYGPLRHPRAPGLSLAGVRLIIPDHTKGLPVLRALSLCTCCRHYPGAAAGHGLRSDAQPYQPSPERRPGRPAHCPFRGLHGVHLRCGLYTRAGHLNATRYPKASAISLPPWLLRLLPAGASWPGGAFTHWKAPPLHGAHRKRTCWFCMLYAFAYSCRGCRRRTVYPTRRRRNSSPTSDRAPLESGNLIADGFHHR